MEVEFSKEWSLRMWIIKTSKVDLHALKPHFPTPENVNLQTTMLVEE